MKLKSLLTLSILMMAIPFAAQAGRSIKDSTCNLAIGSHNGVQFVFNNTQGYSLDESQLSILRDKGYNPYLVEVSSATEEELKAIKLSLGIGAEYQVKSGISFCLICIGDSNGKGTVSLQIKNRVGTGEEAEDKIISEAVVPLRGMTSEAIQSALTNASKKLPECKKSEL